ncbi:hypothetical protein [Bacillus mycoides]|uniref:hypothetical protein n=1 Tax=Bacillus mycoides TaxID=1405 RepID=UPI001642BDDD|nr:hypothetical protein [Bacillus mycoides]
MKDLIYIVHGYEEYDGEPPVVTMATTDIKIAISELKKERYSFRCLEKVEKSF